MLNVNLRSFSSSNDCSSGLSSLSFSSSNSSLPVAIPLSWRFRLYQCMIPLEHGWFSFPFLHIMPWSSMLANGYVSSSMRYEYPTPPSFILFPYAAIKICIQCYCPKRGSRPLCRSRRLSAVYLTGDSHVLLENHDGYFDIPVDHPNLLYHVVQPDRRFDHCAFQWIAIIFRHTQ